MSTIALFDLDGTLVLTGGAGRRALERAFEECCGSADPLKSFGFGGMTDPFIVRKGLEHGGWDAREDSLDDLIDSVLERYLTLLPGEVEQTERYEVLAGVTHLLERLSRVPHVALGLGTGNMEEGARVKLAPGDLNRYFAFGGYGSDHEDRVELLRAGARRGADHLGLTLEACSVVVVGDTPRDVAAAHGMGARCIAVATGGHDAAELTKVGAEHVFEDLARDAVWEAIVGGPRAGE